MLNLIPNSIANLNLDYLNQFINHKVEITTRDLRITFIYQDFNFDICDNDLVLMDETDTDCRAYIPLNEITGIVNLTDDLYSTVVDVKYRDKLEDKMISICCAERKFIYPRCYKCGKEIFVPEESIWYINGSANYGSYYDDPEENSIINSLYFCDSCISNFVGAVDEIGK